MLGGLGAPASDEEADCHALVRVPRAFGWEIPGDPLSEHGHASLRETLASTPPPDEEYDSSTASGSGSCACSACRFGSDFGTESGGETPRGVAAGVLAAPEARSQTYVELGELSRSPRHVEAPWADEAGTFPPGSEPGEPQQELSVMSVSGSAPDRPASSPEPRDLPAWSAAEQEVTLPSLGAELHHMNECTPCKFYKSKRGCYDGAFCRHCHFPHEEKSYSAARKLIRLKGLAKRGLSKPPKKSAGRTPEPDAEASSGPRVVNLAATTGVR